MRLIVRWIPRHVWVQFIVGRVGESGWRVPMFRGIVLHYALSFREWGFAVLRMPEGSSTWILPSSGDVVVPDERSTSE